MYKQDGLYLYYSRNLQLYYSRGNKYQLMGKSRLRNGTEPAVFVPEVAKQHDVFARAIAFECSR